MIFRYKIKFISDIEQKIRKLLVNIAVTPFVGVWIEIRLQLLWFQFVYSHSLRGSVDWNDPSRRDAIYQSASLPSWECGLKFYIYLAVISYFWSLPSWECGLKYVNNESDWGQNKVTPFVGVWIEMFPIFSSKFFKYSHSLRGSVDWNYGKYDEKKKSLTSLPLWECIFNYILLGVGYINICKLSSIL